jgi:hypothetical protein
VLRTPDELYTANVTLMLAFLPAARVVEETEAKSAQRKKRRK